MRSWVLGRSAYGHCDGILSAGGTGCIADWAEHGSGPARALWGFRICRIRTWLRGISGDASGRQQHRRVFTTRRQEEGHGGPQESVHVPRTVAFTVDRNDVLSPLSSKPLQLPWPPWASSYLRVEKPYCYPQPWRRVRSNATPPIPLHLANCDHPSC